MKKEINKTNSKPPRLLKKEPLETIVTKFLKGLFTSVV
jgi:hypothetical protein